MAKITVAAHTSYYGSVANVTAAVPIFDGAVVGNGGTTTSWEVHVVNADTTVTNLLYLGFDTSVDATLGFPVPGAQGERVFILPPGVILYAFASSSRDCRVIAVPRLGT